jgi:hypothetical protein
MCSPVGVVAPSVGASTRVVARAACRRSIRTWRERWPERRRRCGVGVPEAAS